MNFVFTFAVITCFVQNLKFQPEVSLYPILYVKIIGFFKLTMNLENFHEGMFYGTLKYIYIQTSLKRTLIGKNFLFVLKVRVIRT